MNTALPNSSVLSRSLLNIVLVLIEAVMTLILRFDPSLRRVAYPLVKNDTLVCIRTYLPHTQVYATFTYKGVLLDETLPAGRTRPDVIINAYTHELFTALVTHDVAKIETLQIRGRVEDVLLVKTFLAKMGIGGIVNDLMKRVRPAPDTPEEREIRITKQENDYNKLKTERDEQTRQNERLLAENRRLSIQITELQGKQKASFIAFCVATVVALVAIITHFL